MKHFLLLLFSLVVFSVQSEAAGPGKRYRNGASMTSPSGKKCIRPVDYRSKCIEGYTWSDASCGCNPNSGTESSANRNNNNSNEGPQGSPDAAQAAVQLCQSTLLEAQNDCDQDQDTGMQGAQTTLSNFAVQMGSQMGLQGACSGIGKALAGANGAVAAFSQICTSSKNKCTTNCNNAKTAVASSGTQAIYQIAVDDSIRKCKALDAKIHLASQAIANTVGTMQGAQACANQTDTDLYDFCKSNPTAIGCETAATDCSNPSIAASNPICICKANPSAATCTGASLKANGNFGDYDSASLNAGAAAGASGTLDSSGALGDDSWGGDPNAKADTSRAEDVGGSKGGRPLDEGGGGSGGPGGSRAGGGTPAAGVAVNSGFRGGGGGGGGWSNGSGGSWVGQEGQAKPGAQNGNANPDLRQFLPGGKFDPKNRGLAGLSGPDGITGPHTDIWKKIQNRYQIKQPSLMP